MNLDSLVSPELLAKLKTTKGRKPTVDLGDLAPPRPPAIEVLEPIKVLFYVQENHCACGEISHLPLGLAAMHKIRRHGRSSADLVGVALSAGNEFPDLPRERDIQVSKSVVCLKCVDVVRFAPRVSPSLYVAPKLDTPQWDQVHECAHSEELRKVEERLRLREERIAREERQVEERIFLGLMAPAAQALSSEETPEFTSPEDSQ